jgi:asparagine synthase (glutamine-hydrolysing)
VTAIAARQLGERHRPLTVYTAVPARGYATLRGRYLYDEGPGAALVARQYSNIDHHLFRTNRFALSAALDRANRNLAAPYGTPINLAWYYGIQSAASQLGARLVLSGDTGNLTVSNGGPWAIPDLLDDSILAWSKMVWTARRAPGASTLNLLATSLGGRIPASIFRAAEYASGRLPAPNAMPFMKGRLRDAYAELAQDNDRRPVRSYRIALAEALSASDLHDPNEQALHGVVMRDPTADLRVVEAALQLTPRQIASPYDRRPMFERAFADYLPMSTLRSPLRGTQAADWNQAICPDELRNGLRRYGDNSLVRELIDIDGLVAALDHWPRGVLVDDPRQALFTAQVLPLASMASFLFVHTTR